MEFSDLDMIKCKSLSPQNQEREDYICTLYDIYSKSQGKSYFVFYLVPITTIRDWDEGENLL